MDFPLHGSPLVYIPPTFLSVLPFLHRVNLSRPHPSGEGRGGWSQVRISERNEAFELEPTSLKRGEGLFAEFQCLFECEMGGEGEDGGSGMGGE